MPSKPTVISLFSGGGGLDLGLAAAGFSIRFENDIDKASCDTLTQNGIIAAQHGLSGLEHAQVLNADICSLSGNEILNLAKLTKGDVDVLAGGPPCQAFSVFGKRLGTNDKRGQLSFEYKRILSEISPRVFVFENVAGLLTIDGGKTYRRLLDELSNPSDGLRYKIFANRLNAADYGVPQNRDRVIIIGVRTDFYSAHPNIDIAFHPLCAQTDDGSLFKTRTVRDAFRGLPALDVNDNRETGVPNHRGRNHSQRIVDRYAQLSPGERDPKTRINRLYLDQPSFTIIVGSDHGGGKGHVHPTVPREVTPRESARIQTFPDWWGFTGCGRDAIRQVGNAVPCLLGFAIGQTLRSQVFGIESIPFNDALKALGQTHLFFD